MSDLWSDEKNIWTATENNDKDQVKSYLKLRISVDTADKNGTTPLHIASKKGLVDMLMFLLDNYANVNSKDKDGMTPLHYACLNNHADIVYMLLNKKFNQKGVTIALNEPNSNGNIPLHIAASKNNFVIIDKLITVGANTTIKNHDGKIPRDLTSSKEDYDMIVNF